MPANHRRRAAVVLTVTAAAVLVSGCQLLQRGRSKDDTTYAESPVDQLYAAGAARLDRHRWSEGISYFKEVERQHPYSEWSRRSIMMEAYAHYEANQYDDAVADADRFIQLYPGNASAAYAYYLKAECYFEQIMDVGRDQAATQQALTAMREVERRYPKSEYAQDARLKVDMIKDQLAGKEMSVGRWYLRQGDTLAAIGRFKTVVDKFQTTSHVPEALERLTESYLTLGLVEEAKRNAAVLGFNYPGDYWYAQAYNLMTNRGMRPEVAPRPGVGGIFHRATHIIPFPFHRGSAPPPPQVEREVPANPVADTTVTEGPPPTTNRAPVKASSDWWPFGHPGDTGSDAVAMPSNPAVSDSSSSSSSSSSSPSSTGSSSSSTEDAPAKKKRHIWPF